MNHQRPNSIAELAVRIVKGGVFWMELKDFLHAVNQNAHEESIQVEPACLAGKVQDGEKLDAYLAACAVSIARRHHWDIPNWVFYPCRSLRRPWFVLPGRRIRNLLIMESPAEFRERNIFVSSNALDVV